MTRKQAWMSVAFLFLAGCAGLWTLYGTHQIVLSEAQIQSRVDERLGRNIPLKGAALALIDNVHATRAKVKIGDEQVAISLALEGALKNGKAFAFAASATGVPQYESGEFRFAPADVEIDDFAYEHSRPAEIISRLGKLVGDGQARRLIERKAEKAEEWAKTVAESALKRALEQRPIYVVKDDLKGGAIKSSLESMKIESGRVVLTFSLWRLTASALLGALGWLAAIGLVILVLRGAAVIESIAD